MGAVLTYRIGRMLWDRETGLSAGLLLLGIPYLLTQVPLMLVDVPTMFLLMLSLRAFLDALEKGGAARSAGAAAAIVLFALSKYSAWPMLSVHVVALGVLTLTRDAAGEHRHVRRGALILVAAGIVIGFLALLRFDVLSAQFRLLKEYQGPGLGRWQEGHVSTFLFQVHPFIFLAGPMMNILLGFFLYAVIFYQIGSPDPSRVQVAGIAENSPPALVGMVPGDEIVQVNEVKIDSQERLHDINYANLDKPIQVIYKRGDDEHTVSLIPRSDPPDGEGAIGIVMGNPTAPTSWPLAIIAGGEAVYQHSVALFQLPFQMLQGTASPEEGRLVGFKGMFDIYQDARPGEIPLGLPRNVAVLFFFTNITIWSP